MSKNRRRTNSNKNINKNNQPKVDNTQTNNFLDNLKKSYEIKTNENEGNNDLTQDEAINSFDNTDIDTSFDSAKEVKSEEKVPAKKTTTKVTTNKSTIRGILDKILLFLSLYYKYVIAVVLFAIMTVIVIVFGKHNVIPTKEDEVVEDIATTENGIDEEFKVDAYPEINNLISTYYSNYSNGDADGVEMLANPVSDTEKSYIAIISQYIEKHENIHCYTKPGLNQGDYLVIATSDIKFMDVDTLAPGSELFYVTTDADGGLYIDNPYSTFNQTNMQNSTQADIQSLINQFEDRTDVIELETEIQQKYAEAIASDPNLDDMVSSIIPNAIETWGQALISEEQEQEQTDPNAPTEETEVADTKTVYTTATVNIRSGRGTSYRKLGLVDEGTALQMIKGSNENGWIMVLYEDQIGYVMKDYVTTDGPQEDTVDDNTNNADADNNTDADTGKRVITVNSALNIRSRMTTDSEKMGTTEPGDKVTIIMDYAEGWTKVKWKKKTGYIRTDLLE